MHSENRAFTTLVGACCRLGSTRIVMSNVVVHRTFRFRLLSFYRMIVSILTLLLTSKSQLMFPTSKRMI